MRSCSVQHEPFGFLASDYDQTGQEGNGTPWYYDKKSKRKKKLDGPLGVDPDEITGEGASKSYSASSPHARRSPAAGSDTTGAMNPQESSIKRDVHNFIFDDETVVVDDCSFVLPYIEGAYYYQSTTPPPATDLPLSSIDANTDEYTIPLVPAYTEQQLKELLRRQV
jgi:hypothetical protein